MLGKPELSFLLFGFAQALHPDSSGAPAASRALFMSFSQRHRPNDMLDVFETHAGYFPQKPIAALHEIRPLLNMTGRSAEPYLGPPGNPRVDAARTDRMIFAATSRAACNIEILGGPPIPALVRLAANASRPAVAVACLQDAEVLTDADVFVVRDSAGRPHWDVSICDFPALLERHLAKLDGVEHASCEEAVIIGDRFSNPPNLSHFMLDQVTRRPGTHVLEFFQPLYGTDAYASLAPEGGFRYAALTGKDGASDDPVFNDPRLHDPRRNLYGLRDITIDVGLVEAWLERTLVAEAAGDG